MRDVCQFTHSLVSVILVNGANGCSPETLGGDDVLEPCRDDILLDNPGLLMSFTP